MKHTRPWQGAGADGGRWKVVRRAVGDKEKEKQMGREEGERRQAHIAALTQACRLAVDERSCLSSPSLLVLYN